MTERLKAVNIFAKVIEMLTDEFRYPVYSDEVKEDFQKSCFFVQLLITRIPQTINFEEVNLSIVITFLANKEDKNEETYLDIEDRIESLFSIGFFCLSRFIKVDRIQTDRVGTEDDILQITIDAPYLEKVSWKKKENSELMEEIEVNLRVEEH
ncbi:MAG: hypothetical protein SOY76_02980 [Veillonella caviae]|nr:hypothetical protein [Veillonella caviae]